MIRVALIDDHAAVRAGVRSLVETAADIEVVGEAADAATGIALVREIPCDVVLMDVQMPGRDGLSATRELVGGGTADGTAARVIVLTTFGFDDYVDEALRSGAAGFLLKTVGREALIDAVRRVAAGESILAPEVTAGVITRYRQAHASAPVGGPRADGTTGVVAEAVARVPSLTQRERDVLECLGRGLSNAGVAAALVITEATAKTHVSRVLGKLGLDSRVQAALVAASLPPASS